MEIFCTLKKPEIQMRLPIHYQNWYFEPKSQSEFPNSYHGYQGIITCQKTFLILKFIISQPISGWVKILSWAQSSVHKGRFECIFTSSFQYFSGCFKCYCNREGFPQETRRGDPTVAPVICISPKSWSYSIFSIQRIRFPPQVTGLYLNRFDL